MLQSPIKDHFSNLTDPRDENKRHKLIDIVFITICGVICNADKWEDVEDFGNAKLSWLKRYLELPHGIPTHDTFNRVFAALDPEEFNSCLLNWVKSIKPIEEEIINIDGKTVRHSFDKKSGTPAIHMVSAWANTAGITLGQIKVNEKSNEITAIPELLELLELEGCVVTIDAMGTQKKIAKKIASKNADYMLALKGNQGTLNDDVALYYEGIDEKNYDAQIFDYDKQVEKDHGRIEIRKCWCTENIEWLSQKGDWKNLQSISLIRSTRILDDNETMEDRLYISSLPANAQKHNFIIRKHWGIENSLHWVLDMAFDEDNCRKRKNHSAENFAIVRHVALNLLKEKKTPALSFRRQRLKAGWDSDYLEKIILQA